MPRLEKIGAEFLVNTTMIGDQFLSVSAALDDGRFIVVWRNGSDDLGESIRAQFFNADGSKSGGEFQVDATAGDRLGPPEITILADGRFIVAWTTLGTPGVPSTADIRARIFGPDGSAQGTEFALNTTRASSQALPSLTGLDDGRFVSVWVDDNHVGADKSGSSIRGQVFNADGSRSGGEFQMNTTALNDQDVPDVTALDGGRFVVVWHDFGPTDGTVNANDIRGQVFNANGSKAGAEFLLSSAPWGTDVVLDYALPNVTSLADGGFAISWISSVSTPWENNHQSVECIVFNGDGTYRSFERVYDAAQVPAKLFGLSLSALAGGGCVASWIDCAFSYTDSGTSGVWDIRVVSETFTEDGGSSGLITLAETTLAGNSEDPPPARFGFTKTTTLADGRILVTWSDLDGTGSDSSGQSVHAQILDPRTSALQLNGTLANDQFVGTAFGDAMMGSFGNDSLTGAAGDDILAGESGADTLNGGRGNDRLSAGDGNDLLTGGLGSDVLDGGTGDDVLGGGLGADAMTGGTGNDTFLVDLAGDIVLEEVGGGVDVVTSAALSVDLASFLNVEGITLSGNFALAATGNGASNTIAGNAGNNALLGLAGNDTINGAGGADVIRGGAEADRLTGGVGADRFAFLTAAEAQGDVITDFAAGADDFVLTAFMAGGTFIGSAAFSAARQVRYTLATGLLEGDVDGNGTADWSMTLANKAALTGADFLF